MLGGEATRGGARWRLIMAEAGGRAGPCATPQGPAWRSLWAHLSAGVTWNPARWPARWSGPGSGPRAPRSRFVHLLRSSFPAGLAAGPTCQRDGDGTWAVGEVTTPTRRSRPRAWDESSRQSRCAPRAPVGSQQPCVAEHTKMRVQRGESPARRCCRRLRRSRATCGAHQCAAGD